MRTASGDLLAQARRQIEEPSANHATAVHEFRKAMKRWRALLRLYEPLLGAEAEQLRVEARDLARELTGSRDARSALDALADLVETPLSERTLATIRARLESIGTTAEAATLTDALRDRMRDALDHAATAAMGWRLDAVGFAAIADGLAASYARARRAIPKDWASAAAEELHTLRQRVVVHRYQMELAVPLWPKIGRAWVGEAQKLRERLGHHQDLAVLRDFTAPRQPLAPWRSRLVPLIEGRQAEHAAKAARIARRLFAEKPKAFRARLMNLWESRH
ncbi:MAG TPA: CHAD domain-containing protein [Xanthobacteraceae bacterium]|nr:CHAD domain-containing protein [Xanthobacteraceae bacterium]